MEDAIEAAEREKNRLEFSLADPAVFSNAAEAAKLSAELETASAKVDQLYARWDVLQKLAADA